MKQKIINFFTRNIALKFLSVLFSLLLWFMVVRVDDPMVTKNFSQIPVELTNQRVLTASGRVFEVEDKTDIISVSVTGKRSVLDTLSRDDFKAIADVGRLTGERIPIEARSIKYADRLENVQVKGLGYVVLDIENLKEIQLPIEVKTSGVLQDGYTVGNTSLNQNVVKISGPESCVNAVNGAQVKVDVTDMINDISVKEDIVLVDATGATVDTERLTFSAKTVDVNVELWQIKEIPVMYLYSGECAQGYGLTGNNSVTPITVSIAGRKNNLADCSCVEIPAEAVDITGSSSDYSVVVPIEKYLSDKVTLLASDDSEKNATIKIGISQLNSKLVEVPVGNISVNNIPEGMMATVGGLGEKVAVEVMGLGDSFDALDPNSIIGVIDCDNIELPEEVVPGEYQAKVEFVFPEGITGGENLIMSTLLLQVQE